MDKRLQCKYTVVVTICIAVMLHTVKLNGNRSVSGVLRGFDPYMNLVLDDCVDERTTAQKFKIGMVVSQQVLLFFCWSSICCPEVPWPHSCFHGHTRLNGRINIQRLSQI